MMNIYPEFKAENRFWMFWLARIFGKKVAKNYYSWRGKLWICGDLETPFDNRES